MDAIKIKRSDCINFCGAEFVKTYLKIQFSSEAESPSKIIDKLEAIEWKPVVGEYDFVMEGGIGEGVGNSYKKMVDELHNALRGTGVRYSLYSFY